MSAARTVTIPATGTVTQRYEPDNVAHRLLKNSIQARLGYRPYLFLTDAAASGLNLAEPGVEHREDYADVGPVCGRVVTLGAGLPETAAALG